MSMESRQRWRRPKNGQSELTERRVQRGRRVKREIGEPRGRESNKGWWKWAETVQRRWKQVDNRLWGGVLGRKRVVSVLNLTVLIVLGLQTVSMLRTGFDIELPRRMLDSMKLEELPYPLNIVVQVHRKNITTAPWETKMQYAGYVKTRLGTFRNRYPSTMMKGRGTFDGIYVISNHKCESQWRAFEKRAMGKSWSYTRWLQMDWKKISLQAPPIPIAYDVMTHGNNGGHGLKAMSNMLKRQVSYAEAHRRVWQEVIQSQRQRVLILDDWLFPTERLLRRLPRLLSNMDQESVVRQRGWHFLNLRWKGRKGTGKEEGGIWWRERRSGFGVVEGNVTHGTGAYVISLEGARVLLREMGVFGGELEREIGTVIRESGGRVVGLNVVGGEESVEEIWAGVNRGIECGWRRLEEKRKSVKNEKGTA